MATLDERVDEFWRNFKIVAFDPYCDRDDCHGTHVDRTDWLIALRRFDELGTEEVMAALTKEQRDQILWVAYVHYVKEQYTGDATLVTEPPERSGRKVIIPPEVAEMGLDQEAVEAICWLCDDSNCPICNPERSSRVQRYVLRERRAVRKLAALNDERNMAKFFDLLQERVEEASA